VPRRFTRHEAIKVLSEHVTPNGYNPTVLNLLQATGTLSEFDGYLAISDETRAEVITTLPHERLAATAIIWKNKIEERTEDSSKNLDVAYLGLLAVQEEGALRLREEFGSAEAEYALERQALIARLTREGSSQFAYLPSHAQAAMYYVLGMHEYRRRRFRDAMSYFQRVVKVGVLNHDESIAGHLLANYWSRQRPRWGDAETLYKSSIEIGKNIGNQFHVAQVQHSYANLLARQQPRWGDAETLYKSSIEIGKNIGNQFHVAQVSFKYGEFLCANSIDRSRGLSLLKSSLDLNTNLRTRFVAQVRSALQRYSESQF
jgi:tetratricopeptide (TPR) repeat protein